MPSHRRAFALVELLIVIAVVLAAFAVCALALPDARRRARLAGSIQNLQQIGAGAHAYAADNENRIFSFSWQANRIHRCGDYVFPIATTTTDAAADQAVCIMRSRANRTDIFTIRGWIPYILFNHLVLVDYLQEELPSPKFVSPGDAPRLAWARAGRYASENPGDLGNAYLRLVARPPGSGNTENRWPYTSSYQMPPAFFSPDALANTTPPTPTIAQASEGHRYYNVGDSRTVLGNRRMNEIAFPSQKVMMLETAQRFFGRDLFFATPEARVPLLFSDGSASVRSSARANPGFYPNLPLSASATRINYTPDPNWEPPTTNGGGNEYLNGIYLWTRSGLRGRDFNGPEVPWVP